jgi:hypothetical protein
MITPDVIDDDVGYCNCSDNILWSMVLHKSKSIRGIRR